MKSKTDIIFKSIRFVYLNSLVFKKKLCCKFKLRIIYEYILKNIRTINEYKRMALLIIAK